MKLPIYLDYMATTPVDERVAAKMNECLTIDGAFGNAASATHVFGWQARELVENARQQLADLINADTKEIIWTSGATEANNLAIKGVAYFYRRQGKHIITMATEHKAVLDTCKFLQSQGFELTVLKPQANGLLNLQALTAALRKDTILISIMHVNNETGIIQDIASIATIARQHGIKLHVDAAQSVGKIPVDVKQLKVDLLSISAHKMYGPKGMGALYVCRNPRVRLEPLIHGGGHEQGLRSGTLATQQIVGFGEAAYIAGEQLLEESTKLRELRDRLWQGLSKIPGVHLNGDLQLQSPNCLNIYFAGVDGESLLLSLRDIAISSGSACNSANPNPSHVLVAMGLTHLQALNSLRISVGRFTTEQEIDYVIAQFEQQVQRLREMSPIWDEVKQKVINKPAKPDRQ